MVKEANGHALPVLWKIMMLKQHLKEWVMSHSEALPTVFVRHVILSITLKELIWLNELYDLKEEDLGMKYKL